MKLKSESFLPGFNSRTARNSHGGEHNQGKRKTARPVDSRQALHVVLRASRARGELSFLHPRHCRHVHRFTEQLAERWGVRLYRYANVGNHIHLLIRVPSRPVWQRFIRELSGGIAMMVTGARKGSPVGRPDDTGRAASHARAFWDHLVFTRIVRFGRDFEGLKKYLIKNLFEAAGVPMKRLLAQGLKILSAGPEPGQS